MNPPQSAADGVRIFLNSIVHHVESDNDMTLAAFLVAHSLIPRRSVMWKKSQNALYIARVIVAIRRSLSKKDGPRETRERVMLIYGAVLSRVIRSAPLQENPVKLEGEVFVKSVLRMLGENN